MNFYDIILHMVKVNIYYRSHVQNKQLTYDPSGLVNLQTNILIDKLLKKNKDRGNL